MYILARFGITSFVYRRRRPFHPERFSTCLRSLGNLSVKDIGQLSGGQKTVSGDENLETARRSLLRSKGFVWIATSSTAAFFMSHAGWLTYLT